jgi:hypothetical protein
MSSPVALVMLLLAGPPEAGVDAAPQTDGAAEALEVAQPAAGAEALGDAPLRAPAPPVRRMPVELTDEGQLVRGDDRPMSSREFFALAGRGDLVERSDRNVVARRWLFGSAAVVLVAAVTLGVVFLSLVPDVNQPYCVSLLSRYNQCLEARDLYDRSGVVTLSGGAAIAAVLAGLGLWTRPEVLSRWELQRLVTAYNEGR